MILYYYIVFSIRIEIGRTEKLYFLYNLLLKIWLCILSCQTRKKSDVFSMFPLTSKNPNCEGPELLKIFDSHNLWYKLPQDDTDHFITEWVSGSGRGHLTIQNSPSLSIKRQCNIVRIRRNWPDRSSRS